MAIRDVVVLNTTASRLETQQSTDTVRIKGSSSEILSVENSSGTSVLSINTSTPSVTITGNITASGAFSGSLASTASFGKISVTKLVGSAAGLTNTDKDGTITGSAQIASQVSGAFSSGFNVTGNISGSSVSSGSFSIVSGSTISGDGSGLSNSIPTNVVSGAAQLADNISGSFTNGFEFTGDISGSVNSTGSFGNLFVGGFLIGDGSRLINVTPDSSFSGSVQLENDISGSFTKGFEYLGEISGSSTSTGSFTSVPAKKLVGDGSQLTNSIPVNTVTGSAQLASQISGAFDSGFNYEGIISGSSTATASFGRIDVTNLSATSVDLTNCRPVGLVSSSAQLASQISGAFDSGFEFTGKIQPALGAWSAGGALITGRTQDGGVGTKAAFIQVNNDGKTEIYNGSSWSEVNDMINGFVQQEAAGSSNSALVFGGWVYDGASSPQAVSEEWNGTNWATQVNMPISRSNHAAAGQTNADSALAFGGTGNSYSSPTALPTVEWNGSSWSTYSGTDFSPTYCRNGTGFGSTEAALYHGHSSFNKTWDGSSWSSIANSTSIHFKADGGGTVNDGLVFGGMDDFGVYSKGFCTELFDGSSWSTQGALSAARTYLDGGGTVAGNSLAVGGAPGLTSVEHFSLSFNTGSFHHLIATKLTGDASGLSNIVPANTISSSAQIASDVSGSFTSGFEFPTGNIRYANGVWSAEAALSSGITYHGAVGDKTGQIVAMGTDGGNSSELATLDATRTFEYNGSTWSEANDNNTNRARAAGAGTVNSGIFFGGYAPSWYGTSQGATEIYNGTNFSEVADMIEPRRAHAGAGLSSNAALALGGYQDSAPLNPAYFPNMMKATEVWDGSVWTTSADAPNNMKRHGMAGSVNAAVAFGSNVGPAATTIHWNGSTWSSGGTGHSPIGINNTHGGTQNDAISAGSGYISPYVYTSRTQYYDGTVWRTGPNMTTELANRGTGHNQGNAGGALAAGGEGGAPSFGGVTSTESHTETIASASIAHLITSTIDGDGSNLTNCLHPATYISSSTQIAADISGSFTSGFEFTNTVGSVSSVWSTGGYLINGCNFGAGWGTQNAAAFATNGITEEYNGTAWSANTYAMSSSRECHTGIGTQTAGLVFGGITTPGGTLSDKTETYDGSVWAQVNTMQEARKAHSGAGTQSAGLAFGGVGGGLFACSEEWNGTNWSEGNNLITARCVLAGAGTQNAGLAIGGKSPSYETDTEEYDGTSYAAGGNLPAGTACLAAAGTQNYSIAFGGNQNPTIVATTVEYDGTAWTARASLGTAVEKHNAAGDGDSGLSFSGGPVTRGTEEFTAGTITSASFGKLVATTLEAGDISGITGLNEGSGVLSSSAQIASDISGSFTSGFEFSGTISGSSTSTGSFLTISASKLVGDASDMINAVPKIGILSGSSVEMRADVTGSFVKGFEFVGTYGNSIGSFSVGSAMINMRGAAGGAGNQSAALAIGGHCYPASPYTRDEVEEYNGDVWAAATSLVSRRAHIGGAGTQNAAVAWGGTTYPAVQSLTAEYNGSTWTEASDLPRTLSGQAANAIGTQTATLTVGHINPAATTASFAYDGLNWSSSPLHPNSVAIAAAIGSSNSALSVGSLNPHCRQTSIWDGSNWSEGPLTITTKQNAGAAGTQNSAYTTCEQVSEFWNGTSWSVGPQPLFPQDQSRHQGSTTRGINFGSISAPQYNYNRCTEHWDQTFTSGSSFFNSNYKGVSGSLKHVETNKLVICRENKLKASKSFQLPFFTSDPITGSLVTGAQASDIITGSALTSGSDMSQYFGEVWWNKTENKLKFSFPVNAWSEVADLILAKSFTFGSAGSGIHDALFYGGQAPYPTSTQTTELWNGSAWSEVADLQDNMFKVGGTGCSTNAAVTVANPSVNSAETNVWDGSTWTEVNDHITNRGCTSMSGTANAALLAPGVASGGSGSPTTEEWNGTNWATSTNASLSYGHYDSQMIGTQNDTVKGVGPPQQANAAHYDGTSWASINPYSTAVGSRAGFGTANAAIYAGGHSISPSHNASCAQTEEYNGISWKSANSLSQGRGYGGRAGTQASGMLSGGNYGAPNVRHCGNTEMYYTHYIKTGCE